MSAVAAVAEEPRSNEVFLIDASSFVFRAYYQSLNQDPRYNVRPSDNLPTGAVRLFLNKMHSILEKGAAGVMATHIVVAFDKSREGWRRDLYPDYKANRADMPEDLRPQVPFMRHAIEALGMRYVEMAGFEADDLIATYARRAAERGDQATIISADKDLMQMVGDRVRFFDFASGKEGKPGYRPERNYDEAGVRERWGGIDPTQIVDAQALMGDDDDNIPGVPGIGPKTAAELVQQFGSVEELLKRTGEIKQDKRRQSIEDHAEQIRMSRRLASLDTNAPVGASLDDFALEPFDPVKLLRFAKAMELPAVIKSLAKTHHLDPNAIEADPALRPNQRDVGAGDKVVGFGGYRSTEDLAGLRQWVSRARETQRVVIDVHAEAGEIVGFGLATGPGEATYVPLGHEEKATLFGGRFDGQAPRDEALRLLGELLSDGTVAKIGFDVKDSWKLLRGWACTRVEDVRLMSFVLDNGLSGHDLSVQAARKLRHQMLELDGIIGTGKSRKPMSELEPGVLLGYAAERADVLVRLAKVHEDRLAGPARWVYENLEVPLVDVLGRMEDRGVAVDRGVLAGLSDGFGQRLAALDETIHAIAGVDFQISSPKQVGEVLFGHLGLPGAQKTATGQWATRASILDELADAGHEIAGRLLEWRQVDKLKSTYSDALQVHSKGPTGRVHTTYGQAATNTARLASSDPNLQNIPVRTEDGRKIRRAFVAAKGRKLISADYSQIELRVLAHVADVPQLKEAFHRGIDIHAMTASEMFGVPVEGMDPNVRRSAKAINFGIVYGISPFGLSQQLGIPVPEADSYIRRYFQRFPGIEAFMAETKRSCADLGYVTTMFGRRIHFPQMRVLKGADLAAIERAAVNAPIQGSAADIIRRAMVRMEPGFLAAGLSAAMLLQVHDELIFEVDDAEVDATLPVVQEIMSKACEPEFTMSVPLVVDATAADNWDAAH